MATVTYRERDNASVKSSLDEYNEIRSENPVPRNFHDTLDESRVGNESLTTTVTLPTRTREEEAMQRITDAFTTTIKELTRQFSRDNKIIKPPMCHFYGKNYEDPEWFIDQVTAYFRVAGIREDEERIQVVGSLLRGEALKWYEPRKSLREPYLVFEGRFIRYFNSQDKISAATVTLYGEKQKDGETAASFILRKRNLFTRLSPHLEESGMVRIILGQLDPDIRSRLRGRQFIDIEEFIEAATEVENDLVESSKRYKPNIYARETRNYGNTSQYRGNYAPPVSRTSTQRENNATQANNSQYRDNHAVNANHTPRRTESNATQINPSTGTSRDGNRRNPEPARPQTPCRYCGEWHFHSMCPQNPYKINRASPPNSNTSSKN